MKAIATLVLLLNACVSALPAAPTQERFFDWTKLQFSAETYTLRRAALARSLEDPQALFLCPSADGFTSGSTFRQLSDFLYFSGLELPNSMLVIRGDGQAILFAPRRDLRFQNNSRPNDFPGRALADDPQLGPLAGFKELRPMEDLETSLAHWVAKGARVHLNLGRRGTNAQESGFIGRYTPVEVLQMHLKRLHPSLEVTNAFKNVAALRMLKERQEVDLIRRAVSITAASMRRSARLIAPGIDERSLEAELEAGFKLGGAQRVAFDSIIKSGPNSLWPWRILAAHYNRRNRSMQSGELVIYDVGCELDHYASDLGRSFPVSGRFTSEQERRLSMVTEASDAVFTAIRPGVTFAELRQVLLSKIPMHERKYMQANLFFGHHIGLEVGDPSLWDVPLQAGMVFTVEPWYYNHDEELSVFIEDNVLVTPTGCENLSAMLPRGARELEALIHAGS